MATTMPRAQAQPITASAPGNSGASVSSRTGRRSGASSRSSHATSGARIGGHRMAPGEARPRIEERPLQMIPRHHRRPEPAPSHGRIQGRETAPPTLRPSP